MSRLQTLLRRSEQVVVIGVAAGAIIVAVLVLVVDPLTGWFPALHNFVPGITLILLSSFVIYYFARERFMGEFVRWKALGIRAIYRRRSDENQFDEYMQLLNNVQHNLFIVGITLKDVPRHHMSLLLDKASRGCVIELLMLSPEYWRNANPVLDPVAAAVATDLRPDFQLAISNIRALAMSMAERKGRMEVRFYHQAPTLSLTVVDGNAGTGRMRVELTPHNIPTCEQFRPMLDLEAAGDTDLFGQFYQRYRSLWDTSEPYLAVVDSKVWADKTIDREILSEIDLPDGWLPKDLEAPEHLGPKREPGSVRQKNSAQVRAKPRHERRPRGEERDTAPPPSGGS